jgi:hypothetical protein
MAEGLPTRHQPGNRASARPRLRSQWAPISHTGPQVLVETYDARAGRKVLVRQFKLEFALSTCVGKPAVDGFEEIRVIVRPSE